MRDSIKISIFVIGTIIVAAILVVAIMNVDSGMKKNTIKDYKTIVVNGEEYDTRDIKKVNSGGYAGAVIITLKDGTEIHTTSYTLKN